MSDWMSAQLLAEVDLPQAEREGHTPQAQYIATVLVSPCVFKNLSGIVCKLLIPEYTFH